MFQREKYFHLFLKIIPFQFFVGGKFFFKKINKVACLSCRGGNNQLTTPKFPVEHP